MDHIRRVGIMEGQYQPDKIKTHLNTSTTWDAVYDEYVKSNKSSFTRDPSLKLSRAHFMRLRKQEFPQFSIPKTMRFSKCTKCYYYKLRLRNRKLKDSQRAVLMQRLDRHRDIAGIERLLYYRRKGNSSRYPQKETTLIIDAMDQKKMELPHFDQETKKTAAVVKIPFHLVGVLSPVYGVFAYIHHEQWPKGANLTCSVLLDCLLKMMSEGATFGATHILNIQADNAADNKNRFVICFLAILVEAKCFAEANLNFHMVGHTHEDVDQVFSRFSTALAKNNAVTLPEMITVLENGYHSSLGTSQKRKRKSKLTCTLPDENVYAALDADPGLQHSSRAKVVELEHCFDFKSWTSNYCDTIFGITKPHSFNITLDEASGKAVLRIKKWSQDTQCRLLPVENTFIKGIPDLNLHRSVEPKYLGFLTGRSDDAFPNSKSRSARDTINNLLPLFPDPDIENVWWQERLRKWENPTPYDEPPNLLLQFVNAVNSANSAISDSIDPHLDSELVEESDFPEMEIDVSDDEEEMPLVHCGKMSAEWYASQVIPVAGHMCILKADEYIANYWPCVAKIEKVLNNPGSESQVEIVWYEGAGASNDPIKSVFEEMSDMPGFPKRQTYGRSKILTVFKELTRGGRLPNVIQQIARDFVDKYEEAHNEEDCPADYGLLEHLDENGSLQNE